MAVGDGILKGLLLLCSGLNTSSEESVGNVAALSGQRCDHLWRKSIQ